jgi:excisionase family DNA binding protein
VIVSIDDEEDDPWLTLAEIAAELHLTPATIRSWVSSGTLQAWRPGKRKYLVRRSELDRMLAGKDVGEPADDEPDRPERAMDTIQAPHRSAFWPPEAVEHVSKTGWLGFVETEWRRGLLSSAMAPPDPYFTLRLRRLAEGAARKGAAMTNLDSDPPPGWWQRRPLLETGPLSYELRPGGNRPGTEESWVKFDDAVTQLSRAQTAESWSGEIEALSQLSLVIQDIVDDLEDRGAYPWIDDARRGDPEISEIPTESELDPLEGAE